MANDFMIPSDTDLDAAKQWWVELPDYVKGNQSIWVILAMYGEYILATRTVHFDAQKKVAM